MSQDAYSTGAMGAFFSVLSQREQREMRTALLGRAAHFHYECSRELLKIFIYNVANMELAYNFTLIALFQETIEAQN